MWFRLFVLLLWRLYAADLTGFFRFAGGQARQGRTTNPAVSGSAFEVDVGVNAVEAGIDGAGTVFGVSFRFAADVDIDVGHHQRTFGIDDAATVKDI